MLEGRIAGTMYRMDSPHLIVCEAKKSSTVSESEPEAELLGQLRVLMLKQYVLPKVVTECSSGEASKTGILADGYYWRFFHFDADLILYYGELELNSDDHRLELLGIFLLLFYISGELMSPEILSLLVAGRSPVP
jgi:hypothetical protein